MKFIKLILIILLVLVTSASYCSAQAQEADTSGVIPAILAGATQSTFKNRLIYTESTNGAISGSIYSENTGEFLGLLVERNSQDIPVSIWGGVYTSAEASGILKLNSEGLPAVLIDSSGISFTFKNYTSNTVRVTSYDASNNDVIARFIIPLNVDEIYEAKHLYDEANSTIYIGTAEKKLYDKKGLRALSTAWNIGACGVSFGTVNSSGRIATPLAGVSCRAGLTKVVANVTNNELDDITNKALPTGLCAINIAEANPLGVLDCAGSVTDYIEMFLDNYAGNIDEGYSVNISHPAGLSLFGTHTDRVQIGWDSVSGADGYKVYRATSSDGTYSMLTTVGGTSYSDYDVTLGTTYYYKVTAFNRKIESDYSSFITGYITALSVPTGVSASSGTYSNKIKIAWDLVSFSSGYKIYKATSSGGTYATLATIEGSSYNDYAVTPGATYYYKVTAYNGSSESEYSSYDAGYAGTLLTLTAPTEVRATLSKYADRIRITWNSVYGASGYKLYRATNESGGTYLEISTVSGTSYDDYSVAPYTRYYYKVIAYNSLTESLFSSSDFGLLLSVPKGVSASNGTYSNSIKITWDLVSFSSGYKIYRATSLGGPYSLRYTGYPTTFYDYTVTPGTTYYYKVTAYNGTSESAYSSYDTGYAGKLITSSVPTGVDANDGTDNEGCTAMTSFATIVSADNSATTKFDTVSIDYSVSYSISNAQANSDGYTAKIAGLLEIYSFNGYAWADVAAFDVDITNSSGILTGSLTSHPYDEAFFAEKMRLQIQYACIGQTSPSEAFSNELNILH